MKLIIHIGTEKTGSTSIQRYLQENRKKLNKQSIGFLTTPGKFNSRKLPVYCMDEDRNDLFTRSYGLETESKRRTWKEKFHQAVLKELSAKVEKFNKIIISSEHFHSRLNSAEEITRLKDLVSPYFDDIEVIVYLRRQDRLAVSLHSTRCREMWSSAEILPNNFNAEALYYNYNNLLEEWENVFGKPNISVRLFDDLKKQGRSLIDDFTEAAAISRLPDETVPKVMNQKLTSQARDTVIWFNKHFQNQTAYERAFKKYLLNELESIYTGNEALPSRSQANVFYSHFQESNTLLAKRYFNSNSLFDEDFERYPEVLPERLSVDEISRNVVNASVTFKKQFILLPKFQSLFSWYYIYLKLPSKARGLIDRFIR